MKKVVGTVILLLVAVGGALGLYTLSNARTYQAFGGLITQLDTDELVVALTFDDGPTANTEAVLAVLGEIGVKATFFVTGQELEANPEAGAMIVRSGHELGNHSWSHKRMVFKTPGFIREEIEKTDALIYQAGQSGTIYFRPPYGKRLFLLPRYLKSQERGTILWDVEPETYATTAQDIAKHTLDNVKPGSIILLHVMYDSRAESLAAVPLIVEGLREQGYRFVTVSELLADKKPFDPCCNP